MVTSFGPCDAGAEVVGAAHALAMSTVIPMSAQILFRIRVTPSTSFSYRDQYSEVSTSGNTHSMSS